MNTQLTYTMTHQRSAELRPVDQRAWLTRELRARPKLPAPKLIASWTARPCRINDRAVAAPEVEWQMAGTR